MSGAVEARLVSRFVEGEISTPTVEGFVRRSGIGQILAAWSEALSWTAVHGAELVAAEDAAADLSDAALDAVAMFRVAERLSLPLDELSVWLPLNVQPRPRAEKPLVLPRSERRTLWSWVSLVGRATRYEWWLVSLGSVLAVVGWWHLVVRLVSEASASPPVTGGWALSAGWSVLSLALAAVWFWVAVWVRRLHDLGRSAWWLWLLLVPGGNVWLLVEVAAVAGPSAANRFGQDQRTFRRWI